MRLPDWSAFGFTDTKDPAGTWRGSALAGNVFLPPR